MRDHLNEIKKANDYIQEKQKEVVNRAFEPVYHFTPPVGWLNDPNGLIQHNGTYHLFYQFHPYSKDWGPMHWGHATSENLVDWKNEPVALAPSEPYEVGERKEGYGCFSGSAVVYEDKLTLIYTGHVDSNTPKEVQCIATSNDGMMFVKSEYNPVIPSPPPSLSADFRDPKVWSYEDKWYMVVGTSENGHGGAALFRSENLTNWDYLGLAAKSNGEFGDMWECPDLFPLHNKHALVFSPMNMEEGKNLIMIGDMDYSSGRFTHDHFEEMDDGLDFYAAQTFLDEKGRRILIAWMDQWGTDFPSKQEGWAGAMTIPRVVSLTADNAVRFEPVEELQALRREMEQVSGFTMSGTWSPVTKGQAIEMNVQVNVKNQETPFCIHVLKSDDGKEYTEIIVDPNKNQVRMDINQSGDVSGVTTTQLAESHTLTLHLFIDRCSVELFINNGERVMTNRVYPKQTSERIEFISTELIQVDHLKIWTLAR
ncbi:glycoside hydrolase family 32 protein [Bacillus sp. Marseille-P3800]|uniref:glycoside hydrolase family 32 protein n=1 Tax=Bacillus sp. Marseille-P3800 TaxID=2014782 RepID=UPI000C079CB4|nr:glycoside hydrolase family 32 protein [Bacillus sp. Marseille-P3800]